jgi:hypothetical protein
MARANPRASARSPLDTCDITPSLRATASARRSDAQRRRWARLRRFEAACARTSAWLWFWGRAGKPSSCIFPGDGLVAQEVPL